MQLDDFRDELNNRFDKLESKLDAYSSNTVQNTADIKWVKGFITVSVSTVITAISAAFAYLFQNN